MRHCGSPWAGIVPGILFTPCGSRALGCSRGTSALVGASIAKAAPDRIHQRWPVPTFAPLANSQMRSAPPISLPPPSSHPPPRWFHFVRALEATADTSRLCNARAIDARHEQRCCRVCKQCSQRRRASRGGKGTRHLRIEFSAPFAVCMQTTQLQEIKKKNRGSTLDRRELRVRTVFASTFRCLSHGRRCFDKERQEATSPECKHPPISCTTDRTTVRNPFRRSQRNASPRRFLKICRNCAARLTSME